MRAFDVGGIGAALILVAALCWMLGRFAGRRDWKIASILSGALLLALFVQADILAVATALDRTSSAQDFPERLTRRLLDASMAPEFSVFLLIFGAFLAILGWSSTPARKPT